MSPEHLRSLLTDLSSAATVVEAIEDPNLQRQHGWDLTCWNYDLIPWGVRFTCQSREGPSAIRAVMPLNQMGSLIEYGSGQNM